LVTAVGKEAALNKVQFGLLFCGKHRLDNKSGFALDAYDATKDADVSVHTLADVLADKRRDWAVHLVWI
jgi:hypothetical protein